jgi:putative FmdB family regulatory protein
MPIYEYECRSCKHQFEALIRSGHTATCPQCQGVDLERKISLFAVDSEGSRRLAVSAARKRHSKMSRDKNQAEYEYNKRLHDEHDH